MECIQDLRDSFEERGSTLIVRNGDPEEELSNLFERLYSQFIEPLSFTSNNSATKQVSGLSEVSGLNGLSELEIQVFMGKDDFEEEKRVEERMEKKMKEKMEELKRKENSSLKKQVSLTFQLVGNDSTLFDTRDMPFPSSSLSPSSLSFFIPFLLHLFPSSSLSFFIPFSFISFLLHPFPSSSLSFFIPFLLHLFLFHTQLSHLHSQKGWEKKRQLEENEKE